MFRNWRIRIANILMIIDPRLCKWNRNRLESIACKDNKYRFIQRSRENKRKFVRYRSFKNTGKWINMTKTWWSSSRWNMSSILLASLCLLLLLDLFTFEMIIISACLYPNTSVDICTHTYHNTHRLYTLRKCDLHKMKLHWFGWSCADLHKVILIFLKSLPHISF